MSRPDARAGQELDRLRGEIERLDRLVVSAIAERLRCARRIGALKRAAGLPILDPGREAVVVRRTAELARENGLSEEEVRGISWELIGLCRAAQLEGE
jgi:chorismate mutase